MGRTNFKICLAKVVIFYLILAPFIIIGSIYNLIGVINGTSSIVVLGAFGLFGFVLLPLGIYSKYRYNTCIIKEDRVSISKSDYKFSDYNFSIEKYELPFKDRPIFSVLRKNYFKFVIRKKETLEVAFEEDLDIFKKDIEKMKSLLPLV